MINNRKIEELKSIFTQQVRNGSELCDDANRVWGKMVGVGFKPYWTNATDSKIDKIEINYIDTQGILRPFYLYNVIGYKVISFDGKHLAESNSVDIEMHVYNPKKFNSNEPYDKVYISMRKPQQL